QYAPTEVWMAALYFPGMKSIFAILVIVSSAFLAAEAPSRTAPASRLTIEQLIDIKHPSNPVWSADGKHIEFTWDRAGVSARYVSDLDGRAPRLVSTGVGRGGSLGAAQGGRGRGAAFAGGGEVASPDGTHVAFVRDSRELWMRAPSGGQDT